MIIPTYTEPIELVDPRPKRLTTIGKWNGLQVMPFVFDGGIPFDDMLESRNQLRAMLFGRKPSLCTWRGMKVMPISHDPATVADVVRSCQQLKKILEEQ
jgi:hypothetical protein